MLRLALKEERVVAGLQTEHHKVSTLKLIMVVIWPKAALIFDVLMTRIQAEHHILSTLKSVMVVTCHRQHSFLMYSVSKHGA